MFCYQCEQTVRTESGDGCTIKGVCGKDEATADLQDVLVYQLKGIGQYLARLAELEIADDRANSFALSALFSTLTNVNFNRVRFIHLIAEAAQIRGRLRDHYTEACRRAGNAPDELSGPARFQPAGDLHGLPAFLTPAAGHTRKALRHRAHYYGTGGHNCRTQPQSGLNKWETACPKSR